jgi:hypothetical protein
VPSWPASYGVPRAEEYRHASVERHVHNCRLPVDSARVQCASLWIVHHLAEHTRARVLWISYAACGITAAEIFPRVDGTPMLSTYDFLEQIGVTGPGADGLTADQRADMDLGGRDRYLAA